MEVTIKNDELKTLIAYKRESTSRVNREYQRGLTWTLPQKLLFIDSIFRGYSIPAFYFHEIKSSAGSIKNTFYDIVDGQQRIDAIYSYCEGAFPLLDPAGDTDFRFPNFVKDVPCPWAGKRFKELSEVLQNKMLNTPVVIYEISNTNDNEIRDLFIRLQGGTPLTPQDKRDSWPGNFTEFVLEVGGKGGVDRWYGYPFFKEVAKSQNESKRRQLVAQIFMLFWSVRDESKFCDIKSVNIDQFYHQHVGFDKNSKNAARFKEICLRLHKALKDHPKVVGHYVIHLFLLVDTLLNGYLPTWEDRLGGALFEFESRCRQATKDAKEEKHEPEFAKYWNSYAQWARTNSDTAGTIQRRHIFFSEEMSKLLNLNDISKRDNKRSFTEFERRHVFFRDNKQCQYCKMKGEDHQVVWNECEIHHVVPYDEAGPTNVSNGALMHKNCHPKAQRAVEEFKQYWGNRKYDEVLIKKGKKYKKRALPPDMTKVKFEWKGQSYMGRIVDRRIVMDGIHEGEYKAFSEVSRGITNTPRNGWKDFYIQLPGSSGWMLADAWRDSERK